MPGSGTNLGVLLNNDLNRPEEAETAYRKAVELDPQNALPWFNLGNLLRDLNRSKEAEDAYRQAIELVPKNPYPLANPDRLLVARGDAQEVRVSPLTAKHAGGYAGYRLCPSDPASPALAGQSGYCRPGPGALGRGRRDGE